MMKIFVVAMIGVVASVTAHAAGNVGQCLYPKTKAAKNGHLEFRQPIYVSSSPNAADKQQLTSLSSFTVKAEKDGYVQLAILDDSTQPGKEVEKTIGWAKLSDFKIVPLRNCN